MARWSGVCKVRHVHGRRMDGRDEWLWITLPALGPEATGAHWADRDRDNKWLLGKELDEVARFHVGRFGDVLVCRSVESGLLEEVHIVVDERPWDPGLVHRHDEVVVAVRMVRLPCRE